ncbi:MAG: PAS domain S-box protein [Blastocatellia bacterium]|nr:PAS domain S-box protein [Blastocatellia bacterium]
MSESSFPPLETKLPHRVNHPSDGPSPNHLVQAESVLNLLAGFSLPLHLLKNVKPLAEMKQFPENDREITEFKDVYQILVELIPAVAFLAFIDKGVSEAYVSPQIERSLGFTQEEWLGDPTRWYRQIHPDDKARWSIEAAKTFSTGTPLSSVYRVLARDGRVVWFQCEIKMVRHQDGQPWILHGIGFDITELKQTEAALRDNEEMLRSLFEFAPDTVVVVNQCGTIERVNSQTERMFGYRREELVHHSIEQLLPERYRKRHVGHRTRYTAEPHLRPMGVDLELFGRRKDGSEFPVDIMLSPMQTPHGRWVITVIRDITSRTQAAAELKHREGELRALSASLLSAQDEERRRIARELHDGTAQNLAGLSMNLSMLLQLPDISHNSQARKILLDSLALTEQCSREVRNLSYLLHPPLLDDLGLAAALKSYVSGFSQRTGIQVTLEYQKETGRLPKEIETALFRIVQEALANIHRHSGSRRAGVRLTFEPSTVRLEVQDEGSGFLDKLKVENHSGSFTLGVGIPGMRERAKQLGGDLEIETSPLGTVIRVILPRGRM